MSALDPLADGLADAAALSHLEARIKSLLSENGQLRDNNRELGASLEAALKRIDASELRIAHACELLRLYEDSTWVTDYPRDAMKILEGAS